MPSWFYHIRIAQHNDTHLIHIPQFSKYRLIHPYQSQGTQIELTIFGKPTQHPPRHIFIYTMVSLPSVFFITHRNFKRYALDWILTETTYTQNLLQFLCDNLRHGGVCVWKVIGMRVNLFRDRHRPFSRPLFANKTLGRCGYLCWQRSNIYAAKPQNRQTCQIQSIFSNRFPCKSINQSRVKYIFATWERKTHLLLLIKM